MTDLPFDPPYKLAIDTPEGRRWVEVQADGSRVDTTAPATTLPPPAERAAYSNDKPGAPSAKAQLFLKVPFAEKDEAKGLGARWDPARKKWYVPQGVNPAPFSRWTE
ncbi:hypothetical protein IP91_00763 [Pseudoduganella lurida]|uniref:DUF5710 domain-containing protein n=1 Tax=Pseudoduganella lurida TaxID=1036180 RepID=A0A562RML6_9BURK|nr:DUF5710 domain-containing protein [Pseudoduganella lurida]TWI69690.1 hypothetical protein IP91_00763 [Pseudoduganella lurida]